MNKCSDSSMYKTGVVTLILVNTRKGVQTVAHSAVDSSRSLVCLYTVGQDSKYKVKLSALLQGFLELILIAIDRF